MRHLRWTAVFAWVWFGTLVLLWGYGLLAQLGGDPVRVADIAVFASALLYALIGAALMSLRPGTVFGPLLLLEGTAYTVAPDFLLGTLSPSLDVTGGPVALVGLGQIWGLMYILPILYLLLLFPTGRPPGASWRWLGRGFFAFIALNLVVLLTSAEWTSLEGFVAENPLAPWTRPSPAVEAVGTPILTALYIGMMIALPLLGAASQVVRYRRAGAAERAQIRWLLFAGFLYAAGLVLGISTGAFEAGGDAVGSILFVLGFTAVPVAVAIAILRYRLFDIDVIIRRTLQYGVLTAILGGLYFGSVLLVQALLEPIVGGADSPPVVVVTTLILAALFNPLRRRVQRFIDRRFYRRKVDAEQAVARFATLARDEVELREIREALFGVVGETLQPDRMALWLRPPTTRGASDERR